MSVRLLQSSADVNDARATIFGALSDPTRLLTFRTLVESEAPLNVSESRERTGLATHLVSHHLQCLKNCQLVDAEQDGRKRYYEVSRPEAVEMLSRADECIRRNVEQVLGCEVVDVETDTDD